MKKKLFTLLFVAFATLASYAQGNSPREELEKFVVENIKVSKNTMRLLGDRLNTRDAQIFSASVMLSSRGLVERINVVDSIDNEITDTFKRTLFSAPKGMIQASSDKKEQFVTVMFALTLTDLPIEEARDVELFYKGKRFSDVDLDDAALLRLQPELPQMYPSSENVNSSIWIIRSRAVNFKISTTYQNQ